MRTVLLVCVILSAFWPNRLIAQWQTREFAACTDFYSEQRGCGRVAISVQAKPNGFGTDLRFWLANLQGAPSVAGLEHSRFSSLFFLQAGFRSANGVFRDDQDAPLLIPQGGATQIAPAQTWIRQNAEEASIYLLDPAGPGSAGVGGCHPGGQWLNGGWDINAYRTCGDGAWVSFDFSTDARWEVHNMRYLQFGISHDDGTQFLSTLCYHATNTVPPSGCKVIDDRIYAGLPVINSTVVPEPGAAVLLAIGLGGMLLVRGVRRVRESN